MRLRAPFKITVAPAATRFTGKVCFILKPLLVWKGYRYLYGWHSIQTEVDAQ